MIFEPPVPRSAQFPYIQPSSHSGADVRPHPAPLSMQRVGGHSHSGASVLAVFSVLADQVCGCLGNFGRPCRFNLLAERVLPSLSPMSISGADAFLK